MRGTSQVRRLAVLAVVAGTAGALAFACGGGDEMMMDGGGGGGVASVQVTPAEDSIAVGATSQFSATATDANGNSVSASFTWSSTNTSVATVDDQGLATGEGEGMAEIVAEAQGVADSAELTVSSGSATAASIQKVSGGGQNGVTTRAFGNPLVVEAQDENGDPVADVEISWTVASGAASLSSNTTVTGSDGRTQVDVTAGTSTGPITVEASAQGAQNSPVSYDLDTTVALVIIGDNFFEDPNGNRNGNASVSIALGDTVQWEWQGDNPHTVTSDSEPSGGATFDTQQQTSGTFRFAPQTTGTWTYFCEVHPGIMTGSEINVSS